MHSTNEAMLETTRLRWPEIIRRHTFAELVNVASQLPAHVWKPALQEGISFRTKIPDSTIWYYETGQSQWWAWRRQRRRGSEVIVLRRVPDRQLVLSCNVHTTADLLQVEMNTLSGKNLIHAVFNASESSEPVTTKDLVKLARTAAFQQGILTSTSQEIRLLVDAHVIPDNATWWSQTIRAAPPKRRIRQKQDISRTNFKQNIVSFLN